MAGDEKAFSINVEELSGAVDKAVADVLAKHELRAAAGLAFGPGTLIGRQLSGSVANVETLQRAAADVTAEVKKAMGAAGKAKLTPAAIIGEGRIIVGFVAEGQLGEI